MNFRAIAFPAVFAASLLLSTEQGFAAKPAPPDQWVGTWATSPVSGANADGQYGGADMTLREIVHVSLGGPMVRVVLTNEFGTEPLMIGAVHVALAAEGGAISLASANAMTFGGKSVDHDSGGGDGGERSGGAGAAGVCGCGGEHLHAGADDRAGVGASRLRTRRATWAGNEVSRVKLTSAKEIDSWPFLKGDRCEGGGGQRGDRVPGRQHYGWGAEHEECELALAGSAGAAAAGE